MPKIIKDVDIKILKVAEQLFEKNEYRKVDMKLIARKSGVAVGTLYNYYPNKKELFVRVFENSWRETFVEVSKRVEKADNNEQKILAFMYGLYEALEKREIMLREFLGNNLFNLKPDIVLESENRSINFRAMIIDEFAKLIKDINSRQTINFAEGFEKRLAGTFSITIWGMIITYPEQRERNYEYLKSIVKHLYG
ncbi:MAG: TetR/AcrR family transcriptional regulator [Clostridia bacterium]|jgi:AcrR family transcriptional regulator|nr:TetR/AcrR family transcriptional regulator [Clostridia bacterium]